MGLALRITNDIADLFDFDIIAVCENDFQ